MKTVKTRQEFINESNIINCDEYFKDKNVADIPLMLISASNQKFIMESTLQNFHILETVLIQFHEFGMRHRCHNFVWDANSMTPI